MIQEKQLSDDSTKGLKERAIRGGAVVFGNMLAQKALLLVIYAVLARLLTPRDYGLFDMVFVINAFLGIFYDAGLSQATVQKPNLNYQQVSTIFWLNLALGCSFGVVMALISPVVAWFYNEPILINITLLMALALPLGAIGIQHAALLQRRMCFGKAALSDTVSVVVSGAIAISMALRGFGVYSLVAQALTQAFVKSTGSWLFARWAPGFPMKGSGVRRMLRFGGYLTGFYLVNYFAQNLDRILLGRFAGSASLGIYTRAYAIMMYPVGLVSQPASYVMMPALAKVQHDKERFREASLIFLSLVGLVVLPIMAWLIVCHKEIILVLYGSKWMAAAPIFAIICVGGICQAFGFIINQIYQAVGRTDRQLTVGIFKFAILCLAIAVGIKWGLTGVALAFTIGQSIAIFPYLVYACSTIDLKFRKVLSSILPSIVAAFITLIAQSMINKFVFAQAWKPLIVIVASFLSAVLIYFALLVLINRKQTFGFLKYLIVFLSEQRGGNGYATRS